MTSTLVNSIRDGLLFRVASEILDEIVEPVHYAKLAERAASRILGHHNFNLNRIKEDVRERMLCKGKFGTIYNRRYEAIKEEWTSGHKHLMPSEFEIPASASVSLAASKEAILRLPHMLNKYNRPPDIRAEMASRGLLIEFHVANFFRQHWPMFYREPDNAGQYQRPCNHDFKLLIEGKERLVDVSGVGVDGTYSRKRKPTADIHILARMEGDVFLVAGVVTRDGFVDNVRPHEMHDISCLRFWLNCKKLAIPYVDAVTPMRTLVSS